MRRLAAVAALLAMACGGLLFNQGNDFPCDFSAAEDVRDQACAPTEVCTVLNRCERFVYEGPQFEGVPNLPEFDAGRKLHPLVLDRRVELVTANASQRDELFVALAAVDGGAARTVSVQLGKLNVVKDVAFSAAGLRQVGVAGGTALGGYFGASVTSQSNVSLLDGSNVLSPGRALRVGPDRLALLRARPAQPNGATALLIDTGGATEPMRPLDDAGEVQPVLDLRFVPAANKAAPTDGRPILFTRQGFYLPEKDGGTLLLASNEAPIPVVEPRPQSLFLRHDMTGSLWAYAAPKLLVGATVLSTWQLTRKGETPVSMERAWNDCTPCPNAGIIAIAPNLDGLANVEVLCGSADDDVNLVRVVGALSADSSDPCVTQSVSPGFDLSKQTLISMPLDERKLVLDDANGGGVLVGGARGEVWTGPSFSRALPAYLERVPLAIGAIQPGAEVIPVAITDKYIAAPIPVPPGTPDALFNGFKVFDFRLIADFVLDDDVRLRAMVGGAPGWGVLSSADTARLSVRPLLADGGVKGSGNFFSLTYGPRLLSARGEPAREPFFGEAVTTRDGGVVSLVLTADDSIYLARAPADSSAPNAQPPLFPQLTPEPGSPIRSFALERTRLGTDGINRVRGYAVTSRNLYTVTLAGQPARWNATPLVLGGGEPLEVWMDNPRGGLARVGYRDGTVFTLPGGFQLVRPAPGGEPRQVVDYENLGGWPVAYATSGLWVGHYDLVGNKLDNKLPDGRPGKPMEWRRVTMADGSEPWMTAAGTARPGRLHVVAQSAGATYDQFFRLSLFLDDAVYEVGTMKRTNTSAPPP